LTIHKNLLKKSCNKFEKKSILMKTIIKSNGLFSNSNVSLPLTLLIVGLLAGIGEGFAQTLPGVPDSIVQITAEAQGLQRVSPDQLPPFGTFWEVLTMPGGCVTVPLPCPPDNPALPVFEMADSQYLVDCTVNSGTSGALTEAALLAQAETVVNLIAQVQTRAARARARAMGLDLPPSPGGGGDGDDGGGYSPNPPSPVFTTNELWLEMVTVTNQTASLVIHPPAGVSNQVYELLYATNLLVPPTNWQWVQRSYPDQTNLVVPNATDANGFYRLREPGDLVANDSLGTNFWLAFFNLDTYDNSNVLTLFISSPMGATGMVTTPFLWTNGSTVIVSNCGDAAVNGTNAFRNLTAQEQAAWAATGLDPIYTGYIRGTNWLVVYGGSCYIVTYDSLATNCTLLYDKFGIDLTGNTNEWAPYAADPTLATPATSCAQVPFVNQPFTVAAGTVTNINIVLAAMMLDYDTVETSGIRVIATRPVSIYGLDYDAHVSAAFTGYPTTMLSTNYCVMARPSFIPGYYSQLAVLATASNTTVNISPSITANLAGSYWSNSFTMQPGETYQINSQTEGDDVTGTWVTSDKPIAVFAGANLADVPAEFVFYGNPLMQEQLPVESWGKEVLAISFAGLTNGASYRVLAADNDTVVTISGLVITSYINYAPWEITTSNEVVVVTNLAGVPYDIMVDGPVEFQASKPIQVAEFANGLTSDNNANGEEGDPCEILLPPVGHCLMTNIVTTPVMGFDQNHLNIIVVQSAITNTFVNNSLVPATNFAAIGTSGYFGAQLSVTNGVYRVVSSQSVEVQVYGFGDADAYGYFGGVVK
jgi:hypothetical protein